jgi:dipeptidyl aminopeptidase/acylaminoacyl peptidase
LAVTAVLFGATPASAEEDGAQVAKMFGARPAASAVSISADGTKIVYIAPAPGPGTAAVVGNLVDGTMKPIIRLDGKPLVLRFCGWSGPNRIVCRNSANQMIDNVLAPFTRTIALDADGANSVSLGRRSRLGQALRISQFDGAVVDWLAGDDDTLLVTQDVIPETTTGSLAVQTREGMRVVRQNTRTLKAVQVEPAQTIVGGFLSDGRGNVRIKSLDPRSGSGQLLDKTIYQYRPTGTRSWQQFSIVGGGEKGFVPIAVDASQEVAYALRSLDGRDALYRVKLDGSLTAELVYANPLVDVDDVVTIGRSGRVIGVSYITDRPEVIYFDPDFKKLQAGLAKAIPHLPLIDFVSASADEQRLVLHAGSDIDPGRYFLYDRKTHQLAELMSVRPELDGIKLSPTRTISLRAADGTPIPAYLTLPPGKTEIRGLPAIVLPHGGPSSRDSWGFGEVGWLPQFYAQRGFAVLQPQYRGSAGFGKNWQAGGGFRGWRTAIGDVNDSGRWLVAQGVDPSRLAIVGWSYGGYAALQANVLDPDLFKAVVAVAPVSDFDLMKATADRYSNGDLVRAELGSSALSAEASPDKHADRFKAPVRMVHGDMDLNVDVRQARVMNAALKSAGKETTLIVYPGLDHYLDDASVRTDLLAKSDAFLRRKLGL